MPASRRTRFSSTLMPRRRLPSCLTLYFGYLHLLQSFPESFAALNAFRDRLVSGRANQMTKMESASIAPGSLKGTEV